MLAKAPTATFVVCHILYYEYIYNASQFQKAHDPRVANHDRNLFNVTTVQLRHDFA